MIIYILYTTLTLVALLFFFFLGLLNISTMASSSSSSSFSGFANCSNLFFLLLFWHPLFYFSRSPSLTFYHSTYDDDDDDVLADFLSFQNETDDGRHVGHHILKRLTSHQIIIVILPDIFQSQLAILHHHYLFFFFGLSTEFRPSTSWPFPCSWDGTSRLTFLSKNQEVWPDTPIYFLLCCPSST